MRYLLYRMAGQSFICLAPIVKGGKGEHRKELLRLKEAGLPTDNY